jgi:hypothetical protein
VEFKFADMVPVSCPCLNCNRWDFGETTCAAFPEGIPAEIWLGRNKHVKAFPLDHGLQFLERREES